MNAAVAGAAETCEKERVRNGITLSILAGVSSEWRLDKSAISRGLTFAITAAMGNFFEPVARLVQEWVGFWSAFDGARFIAMGA